jgi:serine/threonine protein kinase
VRAYGHVHPAYYLHQNLTVHLNLNPANIWLDEKTLPKSHGFGGSTHLEEKQSEVTTKPHIATPYVSLVPKIFFPY